MNIQILYGLKGAQEARGIVVVVDIFRAASTAAHALASGAKYIIPVSTPEEAFELKKQHPDYILVGETHGIKITGFDYGNSPYHISKESIKNKVVVHRSTQGTQGIVFSEQGEEIIFGSFTVTGAVTEYLKRKNPDEISIVAMAGAGSEDDLFADHLFAKLKDKKTNMNKIIETLKKHEKAKKYFDKNQPEFPEEDFYYSLHEDKFDFIPFVVIKSCRKIIKKLRPGVKSGVIKSLNF